MSIMPGNSLFRVSALLLTLLPGLWACGQITFHIVAVPDNTPHDATLYLTGTFNDWRPGDTTYRFAMQPDSSYVFTLPVAPAHFEYKITRGNWSSVEGRASGRARVNRRYERPPDAPAGAPAEITIRVLSWEDIAGSPINWYTFVLLFSAFQGLMLIIAINAVQDNNQEANKLLSLMLLLLAVALAGRVSIYDRDIFNWQPKLWLVPELILFAYAPTFYFYIQKLLKFDDHFLPRVRRWMHYLPAGLHLLAYLPLFLKSNFDFRHMVVDEEVHRYVAIAGGIALVFNMLYWWRVWLVLRRYDEKSVSTQSFDQNLSYLEGVMILHIVCMGLWLLTYAISGIDMLVAASLKPLREFSTDAAWMVFSLTTFMLGFFAMNHPEIFRLPRVVEKYKDSPLPDTELEMYKKRLLRVMEQDKAYTNPELTLAELSALVQTNTHTLSRVVNEGFGQSFYDFVNSYRVREFTELMFAERYQQETFLAMALQAGFNSKTTFNRAFKKLTGTTPRAYLKSYQEANGHPAEPASSLSPPSKS
ncbi:MAG: hypothetical protein OHK0039_26460 [Bacteroidia bacterium]